MESYFFRRVLGWIDNILLHTDTMKGRTFIPLWWGEQEGVLELTITTTQFISGLSTYFKENSSILLIEKVWGSWAMVCCLGRHESPVIYNRKGRPFVRLYHLRQG